MEPYTVALTSCGRWDLLVRTLETLLPRLTGPLQRVIIIEDSGDSGIYDVVDRFGDIEVIVNDPPMGQIKSIDRLYSRIETKWIFHCEDDWEFFGESFIETSFEILGHSNRVSAVTLGILSAERRDHYVTAVTPSGISYLVANDAIDWRFAGLLFGPGLRRLGDYELFAPFARFGAVVSEGEVSEGFKALGFRVARLAEPAMRHIGGGRHVEDPTKRKIPIHRLGGSIRKRFQRLQWKLAPETHPVEIAKARLARRE